MGCLSVEEALSVLRARRPVNLIVTDLYMPKIDGWRFCRLLRSPSFTEYNSIPIVVVVSATFSGTDAEGVSAHNRHRPRYRLRATSVRV